MIFPDKNIKLNYSLLNCGMLILKELSEPQSVSLLWERISSSKSINNYNKFILTLDYLFIIKAIKFENGLILRCKK